MRGLGGCEYRILEYLDDVVGYGREFSVNMTFSAFASKIKNNFSTKKAIFYGGKNQTVGVCASFCGGGASHAIDAVSKGKTNADTIVTSDIMHHQIKYLLDSGKKLVVLPHYVAEEYGFKEFYKKVSKLVDKSILTFYFDDKRFR
jgi:putative NIF3 family GTP cyclohydrolase 1 type 2